MTEAIGSELRKFVAPEFIFGTGARLVVARYAQNLGISNPLIVTDAGVIAAGWVAELEALLAEAEIGCEIFSQISPNPRDHEVMTGAALYRDKSCDGIITIGGGSPMDCAKGIAIIAGNGNHILHYEGVDTIDQPGPPLICIPTTSGTAADVSQFAIITDVAARNKIAIISKAIVPDIALIDPEVTTSMEGYLTACTGLDALTHAVEAYVSNAHSIITDIHAITAIELTEKWLPVAIAEPMNLLAREQMSLASLEAGLAFSNASLGAVHAMAHSLGGYLDLPHGECNAILLNHVMAFNLPDATERFTRIGAIFGLQLQGLSIPQMRQQVIDRLYSFRAGLGVNRSLSQIGVSTSDIKDLAEHAVVDPCLVTNPRKATQRDIEVIYEEAL